MSDYSTGHKKWQNDENESVQAKQKYRFLKRKLRCLLYEQECFQEELRRLQRKLLRVNRDKRYDNISPSTRDRRYNSIVTHSSFAFLVHLKSSSIPGLLRDNI